MKEKVCLVIDVKQTIDDIQKVFNTAFPFLKIEFFRESHLRGKPTRKNVLYEPSRNLHSIQMVNHSGQIIIKETMAVGDLEMMFEEKYGLHAQVFRKSGNVWLETTATDDWSLKEQNDEGKHLQEQLRDVNNSYFAVESASQKGK